MINPEIWTAACLPAFIFAAIQDWRSRKVSDFLWLTPMVGTVFAILTDPVIGVTFALVSVSCIVLLKFSRTSLSVEKTKFGQADAIGLSMMAGISSIPALASTLILTSLISHLLVSRKKVKADDVPTITVLAVAMTLSVPVGLALGGLKF